MKLDVPSEMKEVFEVALAKALKKLVIDIEFSIANSMLSKSKITDKQVEEFASTLKTRASKKHFS